MSNHPVENLLSRARSLAGTSRLDEADADADADADAAVMFSLADGNDPGLLPGRDNPHLNPEIQRRAVLPGPDQRASGHGHRVSHR